MELPVHHRTPPELDRVLRRRDDIRRAYRNASGPLRLRAIEFATDGQVGYIVGAYGYGDQPPRSGPGPLRPHPPTGVVGPMADRLGHGSPAGLSRRARRRGATWGWFALGAALVVLGCGASEPEAEMPAADQAQAAAEAELETRQARVAAAGAQVMPFDLDRSTHVFEPVDDGGVQTVISDDGDEEQVALIRAHLAEEADRFARGDFHDPAMIHGDDMAGMHALVMGHERLTIGYRDVPEGGEIRYRTEDPELVQAVHSWFEAQVSDHGDHAEMHH